MTDLSTGPVRDAGSPPARPGPRQIWGDLQGEMADDFDERPEDFTPYA